MKKFFLLALSLVAFSPLFAQNQPVQTNQPQEVVVHVKTDPVVPPQTAVQKANEWVEFGKNVGTAMDAGLTSLTDHAEKFSKTDAGKFTMAVIAWKVAGRDALELTNKVWKLFIGVPIFSIYCFTALWVFRRNFMRRRVCVKSEGFFLWPKREYQIIEPESDLTEPPAWTFGIIALIVAGILLGNIVF